MTAFAIFALIVALNLWGSRRVRQTDLASHQTTVLLISIWALPFLGLMLALMELKRQPRAFVATPRDKLPNGFVTTDPPVHIALPGAPEFSVQENLGLVNNLPFLNWQTLDAWVDAFPDAQQRKAAANLGHQAWLLYLREAMGTHVNLYESDVALVLSSLEPHVAIATEKYVAKARLRIGHFLKDLAQFSNLAKSILIIFDNEEQYYQYVSTFYPDEGEFALSSGMFIQFGCPHFVAVRADLAAIEPIITHEMTHSALSHLKLPRWLDEGIAVNIEQAVAGSRTSSLTVQQLRDKHLQFWNTSTIQEFWSGESFFRADDGNLLSYELARILVKFISSDFAAFAHFVKAANRQDAGAQAAQAHLSLDLGQCVASFLESETASDWSPALV